MNTSLSNPAAEEKASLWAARLDGGTLDAAARRGLEAWLGEAPENRQLLSQYCQLSADLEQRLAPALGDREQGARGREQGTTRRRWIVGGLAAAATVAVTFFYWRPTPAAQAVATSTATQQTVTLEDGTQVELNARTRLEFRNTGAERRVRLFEGEAFFSVSHDASRPFFVETAAGSVRVTGTKFNVRSESAADLEVTVAEGSVEMSTPVTAPGGSGKIALEAGNRGLVRNGVLEKETLEAEELEAALAWRKGVIVVSGLTLQEALQRFGRYNDRRIQISPAAAGLYPGGSAKLAAFDAYLDYIGTADSGLGVRVTREGNLVRVRLLSEP